MPSLYTQQDANIRRTWLLFFLFSVLIIGLGYFFAYYFNNLGILIFAVLFSIFSSLISYFQSDKIALSLSRAVPISRESNRELYNIIENLCITAGLPVPKIYITPEEQINAFATGRDAKNASVAVTRGALERLNKNELTGVLSHELSHIGNRDILVSTMAVILGGILALMGEFFMRSMFWGGFGGRRRNNDEGGGGLLLLVGVALSVLAPLGAMLIQLAISRRRESLADESGALLTRYPEGLASALEKIKNDPLPMRTASDSTAHMWIQNPFKGKLMSGWHRLFLTHPPIEERIAALRGMEI